MCKNAFVAGSRGASLPHTGFGGRSGKGKKQDLKEGREQGQGRGGKRGAPGVPQDKFLGPSRSTGLSHELRGDGTAVLPRYAVIPRYAQGRGRSKVRAGVEGDKGKKFVEVGD